MHMCIGSIRNHMISKTSARSRSWKIIITGSSSKLIHRSIQRTSGGRRGAASYGSFRVIIARMGLALSWVYLGRVRFVKHG